MKRKYPLRRIKVAITDIIIDISEFLNKTSGSMEHEITYSIVCICQKFNGYLAQYKNTLIRWSSSDINNICSFLVRQCYLSGNNERFYLDFMIFKEIQLLKIYKYVENLYDVSPNPATHELKQIFIQIVEIFEGMRQEILSNEIVIHQEPFGQNSLENPFFLLSYTDFLKNLDSINRLTSDYFVLTAIKEMQGKFTPAQIGAAIKDCINTVTIFIQPFKLGREGQIWNKSTKSILSDIPYTLTLAIQLNNKLVNMIKNLSTSMHRPDSKYTRDFSNPSAVVKTDIPMKESLYVESIGELDDFLRRLLDLAEAIITPSPRNALHEYEKERFITLVKNLLKIWCQWPSQIPSQISSQTPSLPQSSNPHLPLTPHGNEFPWASNLDVCRPSQLTRSDHGWGTTSTISSMSLTPYTPEVGNAPLFSRPQNQEITQKILFTVVTQSANKFEALLNHCNIVIICRDSGNPSYAKFINHHLDAYIRPDRKDDIVFLSDTVLTEATRKEMIFFNGTQNLIYRKYANRSKLGNDPLDMCNALDKILKSEIEIIGLNDDIFSMLDYVFHWCHIKYKQSSIDHLLRKERYEILQKYLLKISEKIREEIKSLDCPAYFKILHAHISTLQNTLTMAQANLKNSQDIQPMHVDSICTALQAILTSPTYIATRDRENKSMVLKIFQAYKARPRAKIVVIMNQRHALDFPGKAPGIFLFLSSIMQKEKIKVGAVGFDLNAQDTVVSQRVSGVELTAVSCGEWNLTSENKIVNFSLN